MLPGRLPFGPDSADEVWSPRQAKNHPSAVLAGLDKNPAKATKIAFLENLFFEV